MCCGGIYLDITTGKTVKVFFPIPNALIPIIDQSGMYQICQWGQRETDKDLIKDLPVGGWTRIESLEKTYWTKHNPKKVLIPFKSFFEKDKNDPSYPKNKSTEFKLEECQLIQGILIEHLSKKIVYVLTKQIENWICDRYPVIVKVD
ncbi:MAG: hypothetical protein HY094_06080 [Candidatus Melainabacteria bacterium]|nr:hypothetical protein [Candidatus Melainabacteria bacterium]